MCRVYLGLGSNVGDRAQQLSTAQNRLAQDPRINICALSPVYETIPIGFEDTVPCFLNQVVEISTSHTPEELLIVAQELEKNAGRQRSKTTPPRLYQPRCLDVDILLWENESYQTPVLSIPHPRLHERWFVLKPLCDLTPHFIHPLLGVTLTELLAQLSDSAPRGCLYHYFDV